MPTINKPKRKSTYHKSERSDNISKLYNSRWEKLRNAYLMDHPLCEMCLRKGITTAAQEVHHIKPISTGIDDLQMMSLAYDYSNLMALCIKCHHKIHHQMNMR